MHGAGRGGRGAAFNGARDVLALSFSDDGDVSGEVVFAGYGIVVPESQTFGYDSYAGLDVKDKVVLVLRYFPEDADQATRAILARYSDLRYKALAARQRGARGHPGRHRTRVAQRRRHDSDDLRHGAGGIGHQRGQHQRARGAGDSRRPVARRSCRTRSTAATRTCAGVATGSSASAEDRRDPPEARRPQRRGLPAGDGAAWPASTGRGWRSAPTTIIWDAAPAATRWPDAIRRGQPHVGADDNASGTAAVLLAAEDAVEAGARRGTS